MRLVAMPADPDAGVVLGAKYLPDFGRPTAERLDLFDDRSQPLRDRLGLLQPPQRVVVLKTERRHAPLALVLAELKRLQRQGCDARDQLLLRRGRNEFGRVAQTLRRAGQSGEKCKLLGQV